MTVATRSRAVPLLLAILAGALFGSGLVVSGMTQAPRMLAALDVTGDWDPSLWVTMVVAPLTYGLWYLVIVRRSAPWFDIKFHLPTRRDVDSQLIVGSTVFGFGWGLAGVCPSVAAAQLGAVSTPTLAYVAAVLVGMFAQHQTTGRAGG